MEKIVKTVKEWSEILTSEQFRVCREAGTEAPFTGKYNDFKEDGVFYCTCCSTPLFDSKTKFNSGTGWPSFYDIYSSDVVEIKVDKSYGMIREEVLCKKCSSHLGHVFPDGPEPTNLRYCINSVSLNFKKRE